MTTAAHRRARVSTTRRVASVASTVTALALAALAPLSAQSVVRQAELGCLLDSTLRATRLPALGAAIVTRDSVVALDVRGVRRQGDPAPATLDDRFHLGSVGKAITAGLVALLVDEGKLRSTATLPELFPEQAARMRAEYHAVTLRDLLTHRSGLVRDAHGFDRPRGESRATRARYVGWVLTREPVSPRGEYRYSNSNYVLAGALLERVTGEPYESLVVRRLLVPLGVTAARLGATGERDRAGLLWGHVPDERGRVRSVPPESDEPPFYAPAGLISLTMRDWTVWARTVLRASAGETSPWKPETVAMLLTPPVPADSMAMGWRILRRPWAGTGRVLLHRGSNGRHYALVMLAPERSLGVLVATNQGGVAAGEALAALADRLIAPAHPRAPAGGGR